MSAIYGNIKFFFDYMWSTRNNTNDWNFIPHDKRTFNLPRSYHKQIYKMIEMLMGIQPMFPPTHK